MDGVLLPIKMMTSRRNGNAAFDFFRFKIQYRTAVIHFAQPVGGFGCKEHGFRHRGFACATVADQGHIAEMIQFSSHAGSPVP